MGGVDWGCDCSVPACSVRAGSFDVVHKARADPTRWPQGQLGFPVFIFSLSDFFFFFFFFFFYIFLVLQGEFEDLLVRKKHHAINHLCLYSTEQSKSLAWDGADDAVIT